MMLADRVRELLRSRTVVRPLKTPERLLIEESAERIKFDFVRPIGAVDYESLIIKLRAAARSGSFESISIREMRLAATCLFDGDPHLASDKIFIDRYLDALRSIRSRTAIKRLIHTYCAHFDPSSEAIQRIGKFLGEAIGTIEGRWEWPRRNREFKLFSPAEAPRSLVILTRQSAEPRGELERAGLAGQLSVSGLAAHVFLAALREIEDELRRQPDIKDVERAISWVRSDSEQIHFHAYRAAFANALLLPWTGRDPEQDIRQKIQTFLLDSLNDPRIDRVGWVGASDAALEVMTRWLAKATLEQFLKVVDRVAPKHQWDYRRAFWSAYIEKGFVGNAWVAFGTHGAHVARQLADETDDTLMRRFATLGGGSTNQAVLLLSIGDLVVADWSHNGRLRIWQPGNASVPPFNLKSYVAARLRADSDFDAVHLPADGWQAKTEAYIRKHTGIRMMEAEYMPRRRPR